MTDDPRPTMEYCNCGHPGAGCYCYPARLTHYNRKLRDWQDRRREEDDQGLAHRYDRESTFPEPVSVVRSERRNDTADLVDPKSSGGMITNEDATKPAEGDSERPRGTTETTTDEQWQAYADDDRVSREPYVPPGEEPIPDEVFYAVRHKSLEKNAKHASLESAQWWMEHSGANPDQFEVVRVSIITKRVKRGES